MVTLKIYELSRDLYGEPFAMFLDYCGFDHYGYQENKNDSKIISQHMDSNGDYSDDVFEIHPFCWCNYCDYPEGRKDDDVPCPRYGKPNFWYKPTDFRLNWYKYPIRGNDCNRDIDANEFLEIINHCVRSFYHHD